jgi:lipopolysaccharide transport system ATP-binding protein
MKVTLNLGKINLNPGVYALSLAIQSEAVGEVLIKHYNFKKFRVVGNFFGYAPVQIFGNWMIQR